MFQSFSPQPFDQPQPLLELFNKYISGLASPSLPFKLYSQEEEDNISRPTKKPKKRNSRGPYRRYTIQEKRGIMDRILKGEALKGIAEETRIPKRNLIRWKHEFLVQKKSPFLNSFSEDEESLCESPSLKERSITATKESLSQSNIKTVKN